jgi:hypothetical protein
MPEAELRRLALQLGIVPELLRIRRILFPVTTLTWAMPWLSRRISPTVSVSMTCPPKFCRTFCPCILTLRRGRALLCQLADLVDDLLGSGLEPRRRGARVGDGRGRNALAFRMHTTHGGGWGSCTVGRLSVSTLASACS